MEAMMASHMSVNMPNMFPSTAFPYPADLIEDLSRQMAVSHASRRLSRGSNGASARPGNANRVSKPNSASNSPRSAVMSRRTTMSTEGSLARRRQQPIESVAMPTPVSQTADVVDPTKRSSRPLSWHPGFFQEQQQQYIPQQYHLSQYPFPTLLPSHDVHDVYGQYPNYSPAPTAYSCNTSPSSFSPLALPTSGFDASNYLSIEGWSVPQPSPPPSYVAAQSEHGSYTEPFPAYSNYAAEGTPLLVGVDWSSFAPQAFVDNTPPTPDLLPESEQVEPTVPSEDDEEEGEILVGMGLYDEPDKYLEDPHLDNSRSSMSMLMGDAMPMGKGLKLEEGWAPPPRSEDDDEDDDEDDTSEDDASEDEDDE